MAKYYTVVTEKGIEELNNSIQTNKSFSATQMAVGDSYGNYYEPEKTQTTLKNQKYIANCYAKGKRDNYLYFDLQLPPSVGDFYIREVGLFDDDLNLLAVAKYPETLKTKADGSLEKTLNIEIRIELSEEALKQAVINEAGNLARIEEVNDILALKQDIIPDLNTIRQGANLGSTALQSFTETDPVYTTDKPTLALKTELNTKQDKLIAGENIEIENNVISSKSSSVIGSIFPVMCSKEYVPDGCLPCDGAEYDKSQFVDLWNNYLTSVDNIYTLNISGTLTNENGVISGFSSGNKLSTNIDLTNVNVIKIKCNFKTPAAETVTNNSAVWQLRSTTNVGLEIINKKIMIINSTGTKTAGEFVCEYETEYETVWQYTIETGDWILKYKKTSDAEYTILSGTQTEYTILKENTVFDIGVMNNYYYFSGGQINLSSLVAETNGKEAFNGSKTEYLGYEVQLPLLNTCTYTEYASNIATYGQCGKFAVKPLAFDSSKITIVGTPTITDDGVVSDFSTSNYLIAPVEINLLNNLTAECSFTYKTKDQESMIWCYNLNCYLSISNSGFSLKYPTGTSSESATSTFLSIPLTDVGISEGDIVYSKVTLSPNKISLTINSVVKELDVNINWGYLQKYTSANGIKLGNANAYQEKYYFTGSIDLKQFSITVDGKEVYNCVSGNTFKVPTIKDGAFIQQALSDSELGKAYNAGLPTPPQHTHSPINLNGSNDDDGDPGSLVLTSPTGSNGVKTIKNSSTGEAVYNEDTVYGNSTTVQTNAVALRYFVVVATGSVNESQMNWSKWTSSLQGKANTDLNNLSNNGKKVIDGQWISSPHLLSSATATGTYTIDLSSYLPNDNCTYEVILNIKTYHTANCNVTVYTNDFPPFEFSSKTYTSDIGQNARSQANTFILPVSQKQVLMKIGTANASENYLSMIAYRRVGTNV